MEFRYAYELIVGLDADGDRSLSTNTTSIADSGGVVLSNAALYVDCIYLDKTMDLANIL